MRSTWLEGNLIRRCALPLLCIVSVGTSAIPASVDEIDVQRLMADVVWLTDVARGGRLPTTQGEDDVGAWLASRFAELGLSPFERAGLEDYVHPFSMDRVFTPCVSMDPTVRATLHGRAENWVGVLPGETIPDEFVIVGAHYDHLGACEGSVYPGADDNASGVAGLLEVARLLASGDRRLGRTIVFVAFSGEESGGIGSDAFGRLLYTTGIASRAVFVNLDMLGASLGAEAFVTLLGVGGEDAALVAAVSDAARAARLPEPVLVAGEFSDDASLARFGFPAISLSASLPPDPYGYGARGESVPGHPNWHQFGDVAESIDPAVFGAAVRVAVATVIELASADASVP